MKNYLLSLSLVAAMAVPAVAQQNQQSTPSDQPQAQAQSNDQSATGKDPLTYQKKEGFWGHLNPFARKKYVNRQLDPIRGRVNELDELTAKNAKMIADVDARATEGIRNAMSKANEADTHALDAGNRANQAQQTAQQAHARIATVEDTVSKIDQYQPITQAEIRFRAGQSTLSQNAKEALNFQISLMIYIVISVVLVFLFIYVWLRAALPLIGRRPYQARRRCAMCARSVSTSTC